MAAMTYIWLGLTIICLGAIVITAVNEKIKAWVLFAATAAASLLIGCQAIKIIIKNLSYTVKVPFPYPVCFINFGIDPLSAFFICIILGSTLMSALYANGYLSSYYKQNRFIGIHLFCCAMLTLSMILVTISRDIISFLFSWELMSLSSWGAMLFENEKQEVEKAGLKYLVYMHAAFIFLAAGFFWVGTESGEWSFEALQRTWTEKPSAAWAAWTMLAAGFSIKAGIVPLHSWLPDAHPAAPSHVSGVMSGVMIKTGIYGILRTLLWIDNIPPAAGYTVLFAALISILIGVAGALAQTDIKKLLAYSSIENIGIIFAGIGCGMLGRAYGCKPLMVLGFAGAFLHTINHAIFKNLLFQGAGAVYISTHTRDMERLGGLWRIMPVTAVCFLIGSLAVIAVPPLNGLISEFCIFLALTKTTYINSLLCNTAGAFGITLLAAAGAVALVVFSKAFAITFLGNARFPSHKPETECGKPILLSMEILCLSALCIGTCPKSILWLINTPTAQLAGQDSYLELAQLSFSLCAAAKAFLIFTSVAAVFFILHYYLIKNKINTKSATWGCGYKEATARMQYTGGSFVAPFNFLIKSLMRHEQKSEQIKGFFPEHCLTEVKTFDRIDYQIISPLTALIKKIAGWFSWIQSGSTQHYIGYGLIFLVLSLLWVIIYG